MYLDPRMISVLQTIYGPWLAFGVPYAYAAMIWYFK